MKAIGIYKPLPVTDPEVLVNLDLPQSSPSPHDLLVKIEAVSVNPADYLVRKRKDDDGRLSILGWDAAGTVISSGSSVPSDLFKPGDTVYYAGDLKRPGANSEYHLVDARIVGHRPKTLTATEAAALPLTTLTAWEALFERIGFKTDQPGRLKNLLIIGGAGGVGSMAIQLAKLVPDLFVIATASRPTSRSWCYGMGADEVIDHTNDLQEQLKRINITHIDAILLLNAPDTYFPYPVRDHFTAGRNLLNRTIQNISRHERHHAQKHYLCMGVHVYTPHVHNNRYSQTARHFECLIDFN